MKVAVFNTKPYDRLFFTQNNSAFLQDLVFLEPHLNINTAILSSGFDAVCAFVNDDLSTPVIQKLAEQGIKLIAMRCAGFNNVDLETCARLGIKVVRVPAYSPPAVAEHAVCLILSLNRKITKAHARVREGNFTLDGLLGFDLCGQTVGVIGTGKIGEYFCRIMLGFGCKVLAFDPYKNAECVKMGVEYVELDQLYRQSDIISLHCPLMAQTAHIVNAGSIAQMKSGVMIINTGRGGLIDTSSVVDALKQGKIGYLGIDVYEEEGDLFFEDRSATIIQDDVFTRLMTFPNVLITGHQAFFTRNALNAIAQTTLGNIDDFEKIGKSKNEVYLSQK